MANINGIFPSSQGIFTNSNPVARKDMGDIMALERQLRQNDQALAIEADNQAYKREQDTLTRQTEGLKGMIANPDMAPTIANAYGIEYTPEVDAVIKDRQTSQRVLEGMGYAQKLNIKNPTAAMQFVREYAKTGNVDSAAASLKGMTLEGTNKPADRFKVVGDSLVDTTTGKAVYNKPMTPSGELIKDIRIPGQIRMQLADMQANPMMYTDEQKDEVMKLVEKYAPAYDRGGSPSPVQGQPMPPMGGGMPQGVPSPSMAPQGAGGVAPSESPLSLPMPPAPQVPEPSTNPALNFDYIGNADTAELMSRLRFLESQ